MSRDDCVMWRLDTCEGCGHMEGQAMTGPDGRPAFYVITRCLHRGPGAPCEPSWHEHTPEHCRDMRDLVNRTAPSARTGMTLAKAEEFFRHVALSVPATDTGEAHRLVIAELDRVRGSSAVLSGLGTATNTPRGAYGDSGPDYEPFVEAP